MSEAYEFTKATEVELLEEVPEGVNVIGEVNGELKRLPGTGLGGSGGGYDAVLNLGTANSVTADTISLSSGTYDALRAKLISGVPVNIGILYNRGGSNWMYPVASKVTTTSTDAAPIRVFYTLTNYYTDADESCIVAINADGTFTYSATAV